jgi:hypothetical protein
VIAAAAVPGELVIHIADRADEKLLGKKLRCAPVEVEVDAVLIVCVRVGVVVGETGDRGELVTVLRIEIGVADTAIEGPVVGLVGIEGGVVSGVFNLESPGVGTPGRRPRHEKCYHRT